MLSPREPLVQGGPAERLERRVQTVLSEGFRHVVLDLANVATIDDAGVRALARGHASAARLGRRLTLVQLPPQVRHLLGQAGLLAVFDIAPSIDDARADPGWRERLLIAGVVGTAGVGLVALGFAWPSASLLDHPFNELLKLAVAGVVGASVTAVHRRYGGPNPSLDQAQVLLCVSGAMMMIIIGNSLARAFGIAGAASIIRFRTPVEDPKDITVLFLLMGLGMASGLGAFALAGLGTLFLCGMLPTLNLFSAERARTMLVEIVSDGTEFPMEHVERILTLNRVVFEPREISQGDETAVKYHTTLGPGTSLEEITQQLLGEGRVGIKQVSWAPPKRVA